MIQRRSHISTAKQLAELSGVVDRERKLRWTAAVTVSSFQAKLTDRRDTKMKCALGIWLAHDDIFKP